MEESNSEGRVTAAGDCTCKGTTLLGEGEDIAADEVCGREEFFTLSSNSAPSAADMEQSGAVTVAGGGVHCRTC